jgi:predicted RNase H-like HicB family nuclease
MRYPIAVEPGDDTHAFGVVAPDLPGCFTAGDTLDETLSNAEEAVVAWIDMMLDHDQPIPHPAELAACWGRVELSGNRGQVHRRLRPRLQLD